ncbi:MULTISPECIES: PLP-dependent aminotransferase family protein [unclassified Mesorhizobium]|uniref:rhizopine catabolism transcriptional regulator MocR n=1 Tax=unclassified Mesorhizobium TaxID=325217 RepID=UPI000FCA3EAE|nr:MULTISPECIES: PLP-dependent aminotransferase family protein [unclassified Mesorhizobium]TGP24227.1 PLP-dependent aminotransferase family protein [Mesorhizobium sp. M1D.F.Ca.ET.231.01.1.1]TGP35186.1 PLP-dependent aminotransferase family protein [Mesorhizobium sp. M1D.F.Ca.ET.234.01.1.1]TGS49208.1 PLP-dependent aminotransferase family protein [Mesorhizobium sp. M1D.F.Ca.ET.184.01.1.1]TGS63406.1 PLP-dependent aminotransferase family protein [Mesorhizobium sp. M1D.F.Ca.ET.183.01.1.1]
MRPHPKPQAFPLDMLAVNRASSEHLSRQLYHGLVAIIRNRALPPGSELPSTRALAAELGLGRNTIVSAYDQLVTEGYLANRQGARPVIVDLPDGPRESPREEPPVPLRAPSRRGEELLSQPCHHGRPGHVAFHPGMPDASSFPFGVWGRLVARRASHGGETLFGTYDVTGHPALKEAIAGYLYSARGVRCRPEQIVVTTGAQAAFDLLARLLLDPGDTVWMEEPGYYGAKAAFTVAGARILPIPVDQERGWRLEHDPERWEPAFGQRSCSNKRSDSPAFSPRLIYVTPACQHPLGITMRMEERLRLLDIAETANAWVIEDDFDGEYRFQGRPVPAIQSMDRSGRVIYVGTFAKLLFPALRIGFMVLPVELAGRIVNAISTTGQFAPLLLQAALADFITEGHMSRHLKRMRRIYAQRRQLFRDIVTERLRDEITLSPAEAGIQVVGYLKEGIDDIKVSQAAAKRAINVSPLSKYFQNTTPTQGLVLGYAACDAAQMRDGVERLAAAIREVL